MTTREELTMFQNEAMKNALHTRHKVTKYYDKALPTNIIDSLVSRIDQINRNEQLHFKLMTNDGNGLNTFFKVFLSKNVNNYIILSSEQSNPDLEKIGYFGMDMMIYAQSLGLNTWWIGDTFNKKVVQKKMNGQFIAGIIAIGYGVHSGKAHKSKEMSEVCSYEADAPTWFVDGVQACLDAPTALNKQAFFIKGNNKNVSLSCQNGKYTSYDTGILKYSFELAAGTDNFEWI